MIDINYINIHGFKQNGEKFSLKDMDYPKIKHDGEYLIDENGKRIGTKGDFYTKLLIEKILTEGCWDKFPRPKYEDDSTPAYTLSLNNEILWNYDISKGETPLITLRPIAIKKSIGEMLWIYQDQTTDLDVLKDKYGVTWWDSWELHEKDGTPLRTIGDGIYGATIKNYDQINRLIKNIKTNSDSRRNRIDMWQFDDLRKPSNLDPCAYGSDYNVRHGRDGVDYLDMKLLQRSSDFMIAGCINQIQYLALMLMVARECNLTPGKFTWDVTNVQIYSKHIEQAIEFLRRKPVITEDMPMPQLELNEEKKRFYDIEQNDFKMKDYPREMIKKLNSNQKFVTGV